MTFNQKEYQKKYQSSWSRANREKRREYTQRCDAKKRRNDPLYYVKKIFRERKRVAKQRGIEFNLTLETLPIVPKYCPILGLEMKSGGGVNNPAAPSLDRVDLSKGYVVGNVQWISFRANRLKGDFTINELEQLLTWYKQHISAA